MHLSSVCLGLLHNAVRLLDIKKVQLLCAILSTLYSHYFGLKFIIVCNYDNDRDIDDDGNLCFTRIKIAQWPLAR